MPGARIGVEERQRLAPYRECRAPLLRDTRRARTRVPSAAMADRLWPSSRSVTQTHKRCRAASECLSRFSNCSQLLIIGARGTRKSLSFLWIANQLFVHFTVIGAEDTKTLFTQ